MSAVHIPNTPVPSNTALGRLLAHTKDMKVGADLLDKNNSLFIEIEPSEHNGVTLRMFQPADLKSEDEVRFFNIKLIEYVWHWKDYINTLAIDSMGMTKEQAEKYARKQVKFSSALKLCGFLANLSKHGQVTRFPYFNDEQPRLAEAGVQYEMPGGMFSFVPITGATGHSISHPSPGYSTVYIRDKDKRALGHTRFVAEEAALVWVAILNRWGIRVRTEGVTGYQIKEPSR